MEFWFFAGFMDKNNNLLFRDLKEVSWCKEFPDSLFSWVLMACISLYIIYYKIVQFDCWNWSHSQTTKITVLQVLLSREKLIFWLSENNIIGSLCHTQLKCSVMIFILQGHVQQYQLYYIRGVSQERNAVTEKTRNSKRWTLDTIWTILRQNILSDDM